MMRALLTTTLLLATAACAGGPDFRQGPGGFGGATRGRLFVSPMGEPFRGEPGGGAPQARWFADADANRDGALDQAEFAADAARWFAALDRGHDGEIAPDDVDYYETVLFPEIRSGGTFGGGMRGGGRGRGGEMGGGHRGGGGRRGGGFGGGGPEGAASGAGAPVREGKQGAARFGYLDYPEPVTAADTNFNRGIDAREFDRAAGERFAMLDRNNDGRIEQGELPRLSGGPASAGGRQPVPGE